MWCCGEDAPWLRAKKTTSQVAALKDTYMPMEVDTPMESLGTRQGLPVGMVGAVELSTQERLRRHILRGHYPYDPHCSECQQGRGVSRAPRRDLKERLLEVQVDFMFLGTVGSQSSFCCFAAASVVYWCLCCVRTLTPPASMSARSWQSLDCCLEIQSQLISGLMRPMSSVRR